MNMEARGERGRWAHVGAVAGLGLCVLFAGCSGSTAASTQATATSSSVGNVGSTATAAGTPTATPTPLGFGTASAIDGATDACVQTSTPSASLPSTIPAYPGARLSIGSVNGAAGVFGLCTDDAVAAVDSFYAAQLRSHGWQQVADNTLSVARQLTATQGGTNLVITISPDGPVAGKTEVLIIYSAG